MNSSRVKVFKVPIKAASDLMSVLVLKPLNIKKMLKITAYEVTVHKKELSDGKSF
jgi:hypothetical protein